MKLLGLRTLIIVATVKKPKGQLLGLIYSPHFRKIEPSVV